MSYQLYKHIVEIIGNVIDAKIEHYTKTSLDFFIHKEEGNEFLIYILMYSPTLSCGRFVGDS